MSDDYLRIPGAQITRAEREFLKLQAQESMTLNVNPVIATIGVFWGASMWCFKRGAPSAEHYGIDIDLGQGIHRKKDLGAHWIEGDSTKIWKQFIGPIHLLFIDGDHHYETVKRDIEGWTPKVVIGGIVIFHDYAPTQKNLNQFPHIAGVKRAVIEWRSGPEGNHWKPIDAPDSLVAYQRIL